MARNPVFRLFVSSTFDDMRAERQALHEKVFPALARFCLERGARFQPIDLRWGVSGEAGRDHRTMQICLDEIARCQRRTARPNFLALVGDRYGWCPAPAVIPAAEFEAMVGGLAGRRSGARELVRDWYERDDNAVPAVYVLRRSAVRSAAGPWVTVERELHDALRAGAADLDLSPERRLWYEGSATHLEIAHGVLSVPLPSDKVVCVLRSIDGLPADESAVPFVDVTSSGRRDVDAAQRLSGLRAALRDVLGESVIDCRARWSGTEPTAEHLDGMCAEVRDRLQSLIERELAAADAEQEPEEDAAHWSFARARIADAGDPDPADVAARVQSYLAGAGSAAPMIVTGAGGVGKTTFSARLAQWLGSRPDTDLFVRFTGVSADSASVPSLLAGLAREAGRRYGLDAAVPASYDALVSDVWARLGAVPEGRQAVVIVDGVDLLATVRRGPWLDWLPAELPPRVRVVVSAAPGPALDYLLSLPGRVVLEISPLGKEQGADILGRWLGERGRTLQPPQRAYVLDRFAASGLPLYLRLATEEAVRWRSTAPPGDTTLADSVEGIIGELFERLSGDADHGPVLVAHALGYLVCGRGGGLAEDELLAVLGADAEVLADIRRMSPLSPVTGVLPMAVWSRLLGDLDPYLAERDADGAELVVLFHRLFGEVVDKTLVAADRQRLHDQLASYFAAAAPPGADGPGRRVLTELPFQLSGAHRDAQLADVLTDYTFLLAKLAAAGPQALLEDFALPCSAAPDVLDAVGAVLERSAALLARRPEELASQLHGRLLDSGNAGIQEMLARTRERVRHAWLRPLRQSLGPPAGALVREIETRGGQVHALALTPDGSRALAACQDGTIEVWDVERGQLERTLHGHRMFATAVAVTPDGHRAVSGARARPYEDAMELRVWDLDQGRLTGVFSGHEHDFGEIVVLPDGERAVSSSYDGTLRVWDLRTGEALHVLRGHSWYVHAVSVSADGRIAASGSEDGTIRIWDLDAGVCLRKLDTDHPAPPASSPDELPPGGLVGVTQVIGVALTPDGRTLVSVTVQEGMAFWDVATGSYIDRLPVDGSDPRITSDGRLLVMLNDGHRGVQAWDMASRTELGHGEPLAYVPTALAISGDGKVVVTGGGPRLTVWRLDQVISGGWHEVVGINAIAVADTRPPVGVVAADDALEGYRLDTGARLWRRETGPMEKARVMELAAVPGRPAVVAGLLDGTVSLVDSQSGALTALTEGPSGWSVDAVAVDPAGRVAATAARGTISVWDLEQRRLSYQIRSKKHDPKALAVTPDGTVLVSLAATGAFAGDGNLRRWVLASGRPIGDVPCWRRWILRRRRGPDMRSSSSSPYQTWPLAISDSGDLAVTALFGDGLRVWSLRGESPPRTLHDGTQQEAVATLPGDRALAPEEYSGNRILIWDLRSGQTTGALDPGASNIAATPDGSRALSVGLDVRLWDLRSLTPLATFTIEDFPQVCALTADGDTAIVGDRRSLHILRFTSPR